MSDVDDSQIEDDGTMPDNVAELAEAVVGHRIVSVERAEAESGWRYGHGRRLILTLDTGEKVTLTDSDDCCAYTQIEDVIAHLPTMDHIITAVTASDGYDRWHIVADAGEVLELQVGWSAGNPFYYGYGFHIAVTK